MHYAEHVIDLVGNTPLVRLNAVARDVSPLVLAKVEYLNPGGSVKDRIALRMVEAAERSGQLRPGLADRLTERKKSEDPLGQATGGSSIPVAVVLRLAGGMKARRVRPERSSLGSTTLRRHPPIG